MSDFVLLSAQTPREGQACNDCGYCCQHVACTASVSLLDSRVAPCIALEWDGESRYRCGLITRPSHYLAPDLPAEKQVWVDPIIRRLIASRLDIGGGCDTTDFNAIGGLL